MMYGSCRNRKKLGLSNYLMLQTNVDELNKVVLFGIQDLQIVLHTDKTIHKWRKSQKWAWIGTRVISMEDL